MALDLVGGSLFTLLYDGVKQAMVKTTQFNSLLADLKSTLDSLQPRIVEQIGEHNTELGLPNEEIEDLQRQMEEGVKLVRKFSEFRMWNYCCVGDYTDQLIELDRALRKLLEMLRLQEARDVKETLLLSRQNREKLDEVNRRLIEIQKLLMQQQQKAGDVTEALDSGNNGETVTEPIQGNGIQVAALDGGDALESIFGMLFDAVLELEDKAVMFKAPLGDLKSTLASLKPLIEEIAQHNKVLVRPEEELEKFTKQMEKGVELIPKCSKVHPWASCKKSTYTEKLLGLDKFLQRQLYILKRQVARDVRSTIVSIRNVEMAIKQIEESGVLQNQTKGCSAVTEPSPPTLGLDMVLSVEGTRDVEETILISIRNTEAGVKPIEESGVVQNQIQTKGFSVVAEPSPPTLGLDVVLNVEGTRDVEETMISTRNTEAGVKPIEESGVVQNQFETKGTKNASEDYTLVSRISRIFSRNISDTSSSAATSLFSEATKSTFLSEDDRSTDGHILETSSNLRVFRFAKLKTATRNFSPDEIIGQRGFGTVFRGWLDEKTLAPSKAGTGMMVAIKRYSDSMQGVEECGLEVKILGRLSHPNLVKLLGYCYEKKKTLLVYEFVQRGSLDMHLFRRIADKEPLSWDNRFKIAIEAARGLTFLHSLQIIHRDVKPANILLDEDYNPKITSFSLAKWGPADGESYVSTRVCGTIGYLDPEYAMTGHLSVKSDVYSFGVVLLEILTGFDVIDRSRPEEEIYLVDWAIRLLSDEIKFQRTIMDTQIEGQYSPLEALQTAHLALKCLQRDPERRPSMKEVVEELTCIQAMKEKPNQSDPVVEEAALRATAARLHGPFFGKFYGRSGQCSDEEVEVSDEEVEVSQEEVEVSGFLSNISELKWDAQCTVVEDVKNYLKCNAQASYSISSKNFVEPLIKFLRDAHDRDDVKAQRDGFKLLSTFVSENRNGISCLCEETYSLLASSLDSKVTEEVLAIMEILSGHQDCRCKISSSGALTSILKLLNSQIRNIQGKVIKVLNNLSLDREICSEMVSLDCIPKLVPFFKDSALTGNCISILKNLCDTEGARISIAETNGCIASVVKVLDTGTKEEQEHAVDILLSLCSQSIDYCRLVMHEGVIPALVHSSANGTERARINSMEVLRLLRDIDYVDEQEPITP